MDLYARFNTNIQSIIRIFVLGFGTPEANLLKNLFCEINKKKNEYHMYEGMEDLTVWRYYILNKQNQEIEFHFHNGWKWFNIYDDLQLALLSSPISNTPLFDVHPEVTKMLINESHEELQILFKRKFDVLALSYLDPTPTAKLISSVIERQYTYAGRSKEYDVNTLWSIRIYNRYSRENKLNVPHDELQRAYNSVKQFKYKL
jgi:hypothetical protein